MAMLRASFDEAEDEDLRDCDDDDDDVVVLAQIRLSLEENGKKIK